MSVCVCIVKRVQVGLVHRSDKLEWCVCFPSTPVLLPGFLVSSRGSRGPMWPWLLALPFFAEVVERVSVNK